MKSGGSTILTGWQMDILELYNDDGWRSLAKTAAMLSTKAVTLQYSIDRLTDRSLITARAETETELEERRQATNARIQQLYRITGIGNEVWEQQCLALTLPDTPFRRLDTEPRIQIVKAAYRAFAKARPAQGQSPTQASKAGRGVITAIGPNQPISRPKVRIITDWLSDARWIEYVALAPRRRGIRLCEPAISSAKILDDYF
jgi:hypothetical protein